MLKLAGELIEGQLADHIAALAAHTKNVYEVVRVGEYLASSPGGASSYAIQANRLYGGLFILARDMTFDRIGINVTAGGGGSTKARLGIYNEGENLAPGSLLLDAGEIAVDSTGVKTIVIDQSLTKGIYFVAIVSDGTPSYYMGLISHTAFCQLGVVSTNLASIYDYWYIAHSYAALPNPFGTGTLIYNLPIRLYLRVVSLD